MEGDAEQNLDLNETGRIFRSAFAHIVYHANETRKWKLRAKKAEAELAALQEKTDNLCHLWNELAAESKKRAREDDDEGDSDN